MIAVSAAAFGSFGSFVAWFAAAFGSFAGVPFVAYYAVAESVVAFGSSAAAVPSAVEVQTTVD